MNRHFFCHFCFRPSTGVSAWSNDRVGSEVSHCDRHTDDANALAFGTMTLMTYRLPVSPAPQVTQQDPSVTLPPMTEGAVRSLRVEIGAAELEALRATAASALALAREVEEAKRACEAAADALEAARVERDEARAESRRLASLLPRAE